LEKKPFIQITKTENIKPSEVLGVFRSLLKQSSSDILFLTNGLSNSEAHINSTV
jgi:hypothetical protein